MKFADFHAGQVIEAGPYLVTEAEVVQFARSYDPQWFHTDLDAAAEGPFGGLIASGWHTSAIAMRLVTDAALAGSESFASPGLQYLKWPNPVRPGDSLRLVAEVVEARRSEKRPTLGILRWRWRLFNQKELPVLDLEATSLFRLEPGSRLAAGPRTLST
jgi:acyl dehydratase